MSTEEPTGNCPCCARRDPRTPMVCDVDRSKLRSWLREIPDLYEQMVGERFESVMAGRGLGGPVSGSREKPLPIRIDPHDLSAPARVSRLLGEDQIGYESIASELDFWVQDLREWRGRGEGRPDPDVRLLAEWLEKRIEEACDDHPAVDEMFQAVGRIRSTLRSQLGLIETPDYKEGVPCPYCDRLTLVRENGSDWIECQAQGCGKLLSPEEFQRWAGQEAAFRCGQKHRDEPKKRDWYCALPKKHDGDCEPFRREDEAT